MDRVAGLQIGFLADCGADADHVPAAHDPDSVLVLVTVHGHHNGRPPSHGVLQPHVLALRRLVIAEAERFPDLARTYFEQAPARAIEVIANALQTYIERGLLAADDPRLAAAHFAYLVLAIPQDKAQFYPHERPSPAERDRLAREAVRIFLAAYAPAAGSTAPRDRPPAR